MKRGKKRRTQKSAHTYIDYIRKQLTEHFILEVEGQALG